MTATPAALRLNFPADGFAELTFDLPGSKANTLGRAILAEFETALNMLETRKDLRGLILLSGKPGMFIAGADLKELGERPARRRASSHVLSSAASTSSPL